MARIKSRTVLLYPEIEAPPKQKQQLALTPQPAPAPPLSAASSPNGLLKRSRRSLLETKDYASNRSSADQRYFESDGNVTPKRMVSAVASPMSYRGSQGNYDSVAPNAEEANSSMSCPNCDASYDAGDLQHYRDHVESCVRPGLAESDDESAVSQLSSPPASVNGDDSGLPTAYSLSEAEIYPERRELDEDEEPLPEIRLAKITDVEIFGDNLTDCETLPIDEHYNRILNAHKALVEYQDEWIELERCVKTYSFPNTISIEEELERDRGRGRGMAKEAAKPVQKAVNPRALPVRNDDPEKWFYTDDFQLMQDRLEASVYGYIVKEGTRDIGHQDPISQRPRRLGQNQRDLRARAPVQKIPQVDAVEESGDENAPLNLVNEALLIEGGRGKREKRPSTRVASESRASTPAAPRGRPPRKNARSRLQEIQADLTAGATMESTEKWVDNVGDAESRPGSSLGSETGPSTDWNTDGENSDGGYGTKRRRLDTSDFESARKGKRAKIVEADVSVNSSAAGAEAIAREKSCKRSEGAKLGWAKRKAEQQQQTSTRATSQDDNEDEGDELMRTSSNVTKVEGEPRTKPLPKKYAKKSKKEPRYMTMPDGTIKKEKSAATINMERRWAKKREAEALGLEPPKIGRYKKSELAAMKATQDGKATGSADGRAEQKPAPKKRKLATEEVLVAKERTEQTEIIQETEKSASKRRKKDNEQPEPIPNTPYQGDMPGAESFMANSFYGAKPSAGRKGKKQPVNETTLTPNQAPTYNYSEHERFEQVHDWSAASQPTQRATARQSAGKGKKGSRAESPNKDRNELPSLKSLSDSSQDGTALGEEKNTSDAQNAPSGAQIQTLHAPADSEPATKRAPVYQTRSHGLREEVQATLSTVAAPLAKKFAPPSKEPTNPTRAETGLVTNGESPVRSIFANCVLETPPKGEAEPPQIVQGGRRIRATRGSVTSIKQEPDTRPPAFLVPKLPASRVKTGPVAPAAAQNSEAVSLRGVSNLSSADPFIAPGILQTSASVHHHPSEAMPVHDNGSFTTPAVAAAGEPAGKESVSGSSGRPKRNRHPPNKYQVEPLDETPSASHPPSDHHHKPNTPHHQPIARDIFPANAPFIAYETPESSPHRFAPLKQKSSTRSKIEVEYPPLAISHSEVQATAGPADTEAIAAAKAKEAARAAKSEKMKAITKARWASGEMEAVMARKKANNAAKRAAEAALPFSSSTKTKKASDVILKLPKEPKRRQTTHGGDIGNIGGSSEKHRPSPLTKPPHTTSGRKMSEYEQFQALTSPSGSGSPLPPRGKRTAALRASQSFSQRDTDDDESVANEGGGRRHSSGGGGGVGGEDEEETQIHRQFASEYDHYKALASPENTIVLGKRARRPAGVLKEAMDIVKGGYDGD